MSKENNHISLGKIGEDAAFDFLIKNKYRIICRNYRAGKLGEIDIIAQKGEYICFIEVKTRSSLSFGTPSESVTIRKQNAIRRVASIYLTRNYMNDSCVRFDIVEVYAKKIANCTEVTKINHIKNAF